MSKGTLSPAQIEGIKDIVRKAGNAAAQVDMKAGKSQVKELGRRAVSIINPQKVKLYGYNDGTCRTLRGESMDARECGEELERLEGTYGTNTAIRAVALGVGIMVGMGVLAKIMN